MSHWHKNGHELILLWPKYFLPPVEHTVHTGFFRIIFHNLTCCDYCWYAIFFFNKQNWIHISVTYVPRRLYNLIPDAFTSLCRPGQFVGQIKQLKKWSFFVANINHGKKLTNKQKQTLKITRFNQLTWIKGTFIFEPSKFTWILYFTLSLQSCYSFLTPGVDFQNNTRYQVWDLVTL